MSKREFEFFIFDIFIAILKIEQTSSKFTNPQNLLYSYTDWDSVIREFEIIGEASKYLLNENILQQEHRVVVDFRNVIIHEYFGIDPDEVWDIIHYKLKNFKKVILKITSSIDTDLKIELADAFIEDNKYLDFVTKELEALKNTQEVKNTTLPKLKPW